jgi:drug/metabolite transporter (DMT)-like permease
VSVDKLSVVVAMAMAVIFLHEPLTWHHWVGGPFLRCGGGGVCIVRDARFVDLQILRRGDLSCAGALG